MITMDDLINALLINNLNIKIDDIEDRKSNQLKFYLLQSFGYDFGYNFRWNIDGAYSSDLEEFLYENIEYLKTINFDSLPKKYQLKNECKLIIDKINKLFDLIPKEHFNKFTYIISLIFHISRLHRYNLVDNKNEIEEKFNEMNIDNTIFNTIYNYIIECDLIYRPSDERWIIGYKYQK